MEVFLSHGSWDVEQWSVIVRRVSEEMYSSAGIEVPELLPIDGQGHLSKSLLVSGHNVREVTSKFACSSGQLFNLSTGYVMTARLSLWLLNLYSLLDEEQHTPWTEFIFLACYTLSCLSLSGLQVCAE